MRTYPALETSGRLIAFEIPNLAMAGVVARVLRTADGVADIRVRRMFGPFHQDVHIRFRYRGVEHVVVEPWGDNSRLWIGPEDTNAPDLDISALELAFKAWRPRLWRRLGNVIAGLSAKR